MSKKLKIKKGDNVVVIAGDSKGQQGRVLFIEVDKERAIVEGVNMVTKHSRPTQDNPKGGLLKKEAPIHLSNLKVQDGSGKATRIGRKLDEKSNKLVRYSKNTGEVKK